MFVAYAWEVVEHSAAIPERVWALLADARGWSRWSRITAATLEREGTPVPDGVGALRVFGSGPFKSREEVVAFDAPRHLAYELRKGMPVEGYRADVTLTTDGDGTLITWSSSFRRATIPGAGRPIAWFFRRFVADTARRLARAAEQAA